MGDDGGVGILIPIAFIIGIVIGSVVATNVVDHSWEREAVEYGYAEYNSTTGDWQWKPKPIEVTGVDIVDDGKIECNDGTVTEALK